MHEVASSHTSFVLKLDIEMNVLHIADTQLRGYRRSAEVGLIKMSACTSARRNNTYGASADLVLLAIRVVVILDLAISHHSDDTRKRKCMATICVSTVNCVVSFVNAQTNMELTCRGRFQDPQSYLGLPY
jgi:hypothetical protein